MESIVIKKMDGLGPPSGHLSEIRRRIKCGEPLLKYAYLAEGAQAWDGMRGHDDFAVGGRELDALGEVAKVSMHHRNDESPRYLIHLGSGNGIEIPTLVKMFSLGRRDTYVAVDLSGDLLKICIEKQGAYLEKHVEKVVSIQADVENPGCISQIVQFVREGERGQVILIASGEGTLLSNHLVLREIGCALNPGDKTLFSIDGIDQTRLMEVCQEYDQEVVREFLIHAVQFASEVGAIPSRKGRFLPAYYDHHLSQVVVEFETESGEKLVLLRSLKPKDEASIREIMFDNGLRSLSVWQTELMAFGICCERLDA